MMTNGRSAALRKEIESSLASRIPAALSPQAIQTPRLLPIGDDRVKALLGGGLPIGGICEFTGPMTSGRTSLAFSVLSEATIDAACAYIDTSNTFDAKSAAAAGVRLQNLLWVRFSEAPQESRHKPHSNPSAKFVSSDRNHGSTQHHGSCHPRDETKGMDHTLQQMLVHKAESRLKKMEGTPGFPNQRLSLLNASEDQVAYDRFNARRADENDPLRQLDRRAADEARQRAHVPITTSSGANQERRTWTSLDNALRTTDQILQAGGFKVVVLDIASIEPVQALRIPLSTWYRFSRAAQAGDAILLLLSEEPCARSSARCVLDSSPQRMSAETSQVFTGMTYTSEILRQQNVNFQLKKAPARAADWSSTAPCMRAVGR